MEENIQNSLFELAIDQDASSHLKETARWAKFLAIVGFITCGIIVIVSFFIGSIMANSAFTSYPGGGFGATGLGAAGGALITALYLIIGVIYFFPCLFLFNFSVRLKAALRDQDQVRLNQSLKAQKTLFKYVGIMTIIILAFYVLALLFGGLAALFIHR